MSAVRRSAREERSAGGIVLRRTGDGLRVLVIRDPYRNWGLPKGHLEEGEDARQAAEREVREETGLDDLEVGPEVSTIDWYFRRRGRRIHKRCTFFLMSSRSGDPVPEVDEGITECVWLTIPEALGRITYANARETLREAAALVDRPDSRFPP